MSTALLIVADPGPAHLEIDLETAIQQVQPHLVQHCLTSTPSSQHQAPPQLKVLTVKDLLAQSSDRSVLSDTPKSVLLPLTLTLPASYLGAASTIYDACRDVSGLRQHVAQLGYATGPGDCWLPIVLTAKGPLFAEVIGSVALAEPEQSGSPYCQPLHLGDRQRQPLYHLGQQLLHSLSAPPATYMVQFSWQDGVLQFDRLWPFPIQPALASLNRQVPDLLVCHWRCCLGLPVTDLLITGHDIMSSVRPSP